MYMTPDNHSPSVFGVDILGLVSIHLRAVGFSVAILPDWLWLEFDLWPGADLVLVGKGAGWSLLGHRLKESKRKPWQVDRWREDNSFHARVGRIWFTLERMPCP